MENKKTNTLTIIGFILSFILGILGLIVSVIALLKIKKTGEKGKELAIAGIIIGVIMTIINILSLITVIFNTLVWPGVKDELINNKDVLINSVYCSHAFDCTNKDNQMLCYYCEDGSDSCISPKQITCPIE